MRRLKLLLVFALVLFSSFLFINSISAFLTDRTDPLTNSFNLMNTVPYTVVHKQMKLDGTTYLTVSEESHNITRGEVVSPDVNYYQGFISPSKQTVRITSFNGTTITYLYDREEYNLVINNSNYVTTDTGTGKYLYGTPISLVAAEEKDGFPFVKWSNGVTDRNYEFVLTEGVEIGPIYAGSYNVTFEPNNGEAQTTRIVTDGEAIGSLPTVVKEDCVGTTGDYEDRQCTAVYELVGWYLEDDFRTEVNDEFVPTSDVTLYAKWNKIYYRHAGPVVFDGSNYIDTDIAIFSELNAAKDFEVSFVVDDFPSGQESRSVVFADMEETKDPYPGLQFRYFNNKFNVNANVANGNKKNTGVNYTIGNKVILRKINGVFSYSLDGGATFTNYQNYSNFNLYFDVTATFGAQYNSSGGIWRYMQGTLSDMTVQLFDYDAYTIDFNANGGTGMMINQRVKLDKTVNLNSNAYQKQYAVFAGWNTKADGSGVSYSDGQSVSGLGAKDDVITLYAQWNEEFNYFVHFDANGGVGDMADQVFKFGAGPTALTTNTFTKDGYMFIGWNTEPDGSGTSYKDGEEVSNLASNPNELITLYAQYLKIAFMHTEGFTFDGVVKIIDTGVNIGRQQNLTKDFVIKFTIDEVASDVTASQMQPTIINGKDESNPLWPGFCIRFNNWNNKNIIPTYKWNGTTNSSTYLSPINVNKVPIQMVIKRTDQVVTVSYSYQGFESEEFKMYDQHDWTLNTYYADNVTFGGIYNANHLPDRFFKGKLSNMIILMDD